MQAPLQDAQAAAREPLGQWPGLQAQRLQLGQQLLLGSARAAQVAGKTAGKLVLAQQGEQLRQRQLCRFLHPAEGQQRLQRLAGVTDFGIIEAVAAKQLTFAHDHAHHQRLRRFGQLTERADESQFLVVEQVCVALFDPQQHLAKIVQVVERVIDGMGDHWQWGQAAGLGTGYTYRPARLASAVGRAAFNPQYRRAARNAAPMPGPGAPQPVAGPRYALPSTPAPDTADTAPAG